MVYLGFHAITIDVKYFYIEIAAYCICINGICFCINENVYLLLVHHNALLPSRQNQRLLYPQLQQAGTLLETARHRLGNALDPRWSVTPPHNWPRQSSKKE